MKKHDNAAALERLYDAFLSLRDRDECRAFLDDVCTIKEITDMAQRLQTAFLIDDGVSYQKISESIGISTATISRVSRCLNYGAGGYRAVIDRTKEEEA
jgi:TrpR-related protein YerC/YecD